MNTTCRRGGAFLQGLALEIEARRAGRACPCAAGHDQNDSKIPNSCEIQ